jgi:hypothetical protein
MLQMWEEMLNQHVCCLGEMEQSINRPKPLGCLTVPNAMVAAVLSCCQSARPSAGQLRRQTLSSTYYGSNLVQLVSSECRPEIYE